MESDATANGELEQEQPASSLPCAIREQLTGHLVLIDPIRSWSTL